MVDHHDQPRLLRGAPVDDPLRNAAAAAWSCRFRRRRSTTRCGSAAKSSSTRASRSSSTPSGMPRRAGPAGGARRARPAGSSRTGASPGRGQAAATRRDQCGRVGIGGAAGAASTNGAPSGASPWPGRAGTAAALRRSISDSAGSPSRSSSRPPSRSLSAGRSSRPPRGRHHEVHPVGQALRGQREQPILQVFELVAQRQLAVDHQQQVGGGLVGEPPAARRARNASTDVTPASRNSRSRRASTATISATVRRTSRARCRSATPPTCGSPASGRSAPPPKSSSACTLGRGVGERETECHRRRQRRSTCPPAARRRPRRAPPHRTRSTTSGSRRCW